MASESAVRVLVRLRPFLPDETRPEEPAVQVPKGKKNLVVRQGRKTFDFAFDGALDERATQADAYKLVSDLVSQAVDGVNATVFAYGQTGTGKTFTMSGKEWTEHHGAVPASGRGVIPRAMAQLAAAAAADAALQLQVSYLEVYNERIYDLLAPLEQDEHGNETLTSRDVSGGALRLRQGAQAGTVEVVGLRSESARSEPELLDVLARGNAVRAVRDTQFNEHSTRSHAVLQVVITARRGGGAASTCSKLTFVDLAGSERWDVRGGLNDAHVSELSSINRSLHSLSLCVFALTEKGRSHIPYRDSVLTRLLQDSLGGSARTAFVISVAPTEAAVHETLNSIKFAERCKSVTTAPVVHRLVQPSLASQRSYYQNQIARLQNQIAQLKSHVRSSRSNNADEEALDARSRIAAENRRLRAELQQSQMQLEEERRARAALERQRARPHGSPSRRNYDLPPLDASGSPLSTASASSPDRPPPLRMSPLRSPARRQQPAVSNSSSKSKLSPGGGSGNDDEVHVLLAELRAQEQNLERIMAEEVAIQAEIRRRTSASASSSEASVDGPSAVDVFLSPGSAAAAAAAVAPAPAPAPGRAPAAGAPALPPRPKPLAPPPPRRPRRVTDEEAIANVYGPPPKPVPVPPPVRRAARPKRTRPQFAGRSTNSTPRAVAELHWDRPDLARELEGRLARSSSSSTAAQPQPPSGERAAREREQRRRYYTQGAARKRRERRQQTGGGAGGAAPRGRRRPRDHSGGRRRRRTPSPIEGVDQALEETAVEAVVAHRERHGRVQYKVRWAGADPDEDEWCERDELAEAADPVPYLLAEYERRNVGVADGAVEARTRYQELKAELEREMSELDV